MKIRFHWHPLVLETWRKALGNQPLSYPFPGVTEQPRSISGFNEDHYELLLGEGQATWEAACAAMQTWLVFPSGWTRIHAPENVPAAGQTVVMGARFSGVWWCNACRVLRTVCTENTCGFAYGTIQKAHIEHGEEWFGVHRDAHGRVWYRISAWSRPQWPLAWLGYPLIRMLQARFRAHSGRGVLAYVQGQLANPVRSKNTTL